MSPRPAPRDRSFGVEAATAMCFTDSAYNAVATPAPRVRGRHRGRRWPWRLRDPVRTARRQKRRS